jgi:hypothetical protein
VTTHYQDDTTIDDVPFGDRLSCLCECGHQTWPAWRTLPKATQFTPLRDLRKKIVCKRCGARNPVLVIEGSGDPKSGWPTIVWTYPRNADVYELVKRRPKSPSASRP